MRPQKPVPADICRVALVALIFCADGAQGQRVESTIDVGAMGLRYADTVNAGALAVSPQAVFERGSTLADASATVSQFTSGGWGAQGALSASYFTDLGRRMVAEIGGFAGGSSHRGGGGTGEVLANLRLHYMRETKEFFAGAGVGRVSFGGGAQTVVAGELGVAARFGETDATLTVSPVSVDSTKYADSQLSLSWRRGNTSLDGLIGFRVGDQLAALGASSRTWGSVSAVVWLKPHLAAVLSGGTYPIDPTQGFPGGRFVSASVRISRASHRAVDSVVPNPAYPVATSDTSPEIDEFTWEKSQTRTVALRVRAPRASSVEVTGDFTNWNPVGLVQTAEAGWWSVALPLRPGKYQMNLRVNGGKWLVPPGILSMADEFGGMVGLLVIE